MIWYKDDECYVCSHVKFSSVFQMHHGQPGGDVHGAADAVQQDVRHGPGQADGRARRGPVTAEAGIRPAPVSKHFIFFHRFFCFFTFLGNIMRPAVTFICHPNYSSELF